MGAIISTSLGTGRVGLKVFDHPFGQVYWYQCPECRDTPCFSSIEKEWIVMELSAGERAYAFIQQCPKCGLTSIHYREPI